MPDHVMGDAEKKAMFDKMAEDYDKNFPLMTEFARDAIALAPPITPTSRVHDNASGPGVFSGLLLEAQADVNIDATDISDGMLAAAKKRYPSITTQNMDINNLDGFEDGRFTHSFTGFAFVSMAPADVEKGVKELYRTLGDGGVAVVSGWQKVGWVADWLSPLVKTTAKELGKDPTSIPDSLPTVKGDAFTSAAKAAGFKEVSVDTKERKIPSEVLGKGPNAAATQGIIGVLTQGFTDEEKATVIGKVMEELKKVVEEDRHFGMTAWLAVLKK